MPDVRFEQFYRDTVTLTWPPVDAIARRGRQRRTRQRFAAGVGAAVVAVGVVLAGAAVRGGSAGPAPVPPASPPVAVTPSATGSAQPPVSPGSPSGTPASSRPPQLTEVPLAAMLRPADAGAGTWAVTEEANGDWTVFFPLSLCNAASSIPYVNDIHERSRTLDRGQASIVQRVMAFAPGRTAEHLDSLRAKVSACRSFEAKYTGDQMTVRIIQDGFAAADESFVVEVGSSGGVALHAFVRRGGLVTEVVAVPNTLAETLRVGRAAAGRLAAAGG